jgi:hypothetical protein
MSKANNQKSYLIIFEDNDIKHATSVGQDELRSCDDGYLDVIDITDPLKPLYFLNGVWVSVPKQAELPLDYLHDDE